MNVRDHLGSLRALAETLDMPLDEFAMIEGRLDQDACNVAVLGEWSRGKSSLINAILGQDLLPADIRPTTASLVAIEKGPVLRMKLEGEDAEVFDNDAEGLAEALRNLQTEESGGVADPSKWAEIELPLDALEGLRILDTPGVNDLGETAPELVYRLLPFVDVLIFVLDASAGFTASERNFVANCLYPRVCPPLIFFANKIDRVEIDEEEELEEIEESLREAVSGLVGERGRVVIGAVGPGEGLRSHTVGQIMELVRAQREMALQLRSRRLISYLANKVSLIASGELKTLDREQDDLEAELERLRHAQGSIQAGFAMLSDHVCKVGARDLTSMIDKSLDTFEERAKLEIERRVALVASPSDYAEMALEQDLRSLAQGWVDQHIIEIKNFLDRHRAYVAAEFEINFGEIVSPNGRHEAASLVQLEVDKVDASFMRGAERSARNAGYVLPAAGGILAAFIAAPLAVVGLLAGKYIADQRAEAQRSASREQLSELARMLVADAVEHLRTNLRRMTEGWFSSFAASLSDECNRVITARQDQLADALALGEADSSQRQARRQEVEGVIQRILEVREDVEQ